MANPLDLSSSIGKWERAIEHLEALKGELTAVQKSPPYAFRHGEVDSKSLWCSVYMKVLDPPWRRRCALLVGDIHHNLRCALDYIITALADRDGVPLTLKHQFPIFTKKDPYRRVVARDLKGIKLDMSALGIPIIEGFQPFQTNPKAPEEAPLWHLHRFSNADKHRALSVTYPRFVVGDFALAANAPQVDFWEPPKPHTWEEDREFEVRRVRFAWMPTKIRLQHEYSVAVEFIARRTVQGEAKGIGHDLPFLEEICRQVRLVAEYFKEI